MQQLTDEGRQLVNGVAQRHGFSIDAVTQMLQSVANGYGNQAQFNHPEFGGMGQWSSGGMVMIGDMFNNNLKGRVSSLCQELANLVQGQSLFQMPAQSQSQSQGGGWQGQGGSQQSQGSGWQGQQQPSGQQQSQGGSSGSSLFVGGGQSGNWWPSDLGQAGSTGSQNNLRYAYFPMARRLAIDINGQVTVYDTGDNQIGGFSQQQSGDQSLTFTSQFGLVRVADLPLVSGGSNAVNNSGPSFTTNSNQSNFAASQNPPPAPVVQPAPQMQQQPAPSQNATSPAPMPQPSQSAPRPGVHMTPDDVFAMIEKLAALHEKGILTDAEYETKKSDMLNRL